MDYSVAEKHAVREAFEAMLEGLDAADREPDRWEEECLARSMAAMLCGRYRLAAVQVTKASVPEHYRDQQPMAGLDVAPPALSKEDFRRGLAELRQSAGERD